MRLRILIAACFVSFLFLSPAGAGHSITKSYTVGTTPVLAVQFTPSSLPVVVGGNWFPGHSLERPESVVIVDRSGGPVSFFVCQDLDGDAVCGNQNPDVGDLEPRVEACGSGADLISGGFQYNYTIRVFVRATDPNCPSAAIGGDITLTFEDLEEQ